MTFNQDQYYWTDCYSNEKSLIIQTLSGFSMVMIDHLYPPHILPLDTSATILGATVLLALENSRTLTNEIERIDFLRLENTKPRYDAWVSYLIEALDYKNKRTLFKNMMSCSIRLHNGIIRIRPSYHVKLEAWEGIKGVDNIILTLDNTPEEIGAGLRLALSLCR